MSDTVSQSPTKQLAGDAVKRGVQVLHLPSPKQSPTVRQKKKEGWSKPLLKLAIVEYPAEQPVKLPDFIPWALRLPNLKAVKDVLAMYLVIMDDKFIEARKPTCRHEILLRPQHEPLLRLQAYCEAVGGRHGVAGTCGLVCPSVREHAGVVRGTWAESKQIIGAGHTRLAKEALSKFCSAAM
ncbi:hypothetical protein PybrP1_007002 [[Pythium] brassicae (nom. inval.)]|nr:hypothetical protein PybrP1_007002 [[Pythium] brassicae (nom. inval.)]